MSLRLHPGMSRAGGGARDNARVKRPRTRDRHEGIFRGFGPVIILDGGLATTLEAKGYDLDHPLWSARLLAEAPEAIRQVHLDFLAAGADCITTATYQASLPGFARQGLSAEQGRDRLLEAVRLAIEARDAFWADERNRAGRVHPLVAASIGPYGAFLADGSEYSGDYGITPGDLLAFHEERWRVLAGSDADLLACETIPSRDEVEVLLQLLTGKPQCRAWVSFSCRDGRRICDGTPIKEVASACHRVDGVVAVGINCTAPEYVSSLMGEIRKGTDKPVIVYPNSGERYEAHRKGWSGRENAFDWTRGVDAWCRLGAVGIGGCCRIGPDDIARMRRQLIG